jgi:hypothetical protein
VSPPHSARSSIHVLGKYCPPPLSVVQHKAPHYRSLIRRTVLCQPVEKRLHRISRIDPRSRSFIRSPLDRVRGMTWSWNSRLRYAIAELQGQGAYLFWALLRSLSCSPRRATTIRPNLRCTMTHCRSPRLKVSAECWPRLKSLRLTLLIEGDGSTTLFQGHHTKPSGILSPRLHEF